MPLISTTRVVAGSNNCIVLSHPKLRGVAVIAPVIFAMIGCATNGRKPGDAEAIAQVRTFVDRCERAIDARNWMDFEECFLPTAKILYAEEGSSEFEEMELGEWIVSLRFRSSHLGYARNREILGLEFEASRSQLLVRSKLIERFLVPGGRKVFTMTEAMVVVRKNGTSRIASIVHRIDQERVEEL